MHFLLLKNRTSGSLVKSKYFLQMFYAQLKNLVNVILLHEAPNKTTDYSEMAESQPFVVYN